jgi:hypothetical protein
MEALMETFWEILFAVSEAVTVMVTLPDVEVLAAETVRVAEPDPPVMVVLSKLVVMFVLEEEAFSDTVPVKPFTAETLMAKVAEAPALITWEVGLADKLNSELLPPLPVPFTERRGDITQPFATINTLVRNNANLRMGESLSSAGPNHYESHTFGLSLGVRCLPRNGKQLVRE